MILTNPDLTTRNLFVTEDQQRFNRLNLAFEINRPPEEEEGARRRLIETAGATRSDDNRIQRAPQARYKAKLLRDGAVT